ncbi:biotin--[acetyl-CoA-carboxylase] ligase [Acidihalobacter ferrooxydans]|uniref:Biotin--[acetyl-CoA-carboxylase] ligase n=1 Tax=Acidihalobacter ferrooxydans TaxID=1765967 RepID=A0A1P8UIQ1_9GAMM|nr:biotin--[acetyl-CoA-carboxylase] ligase [Acidihalobacter ferrooxydans]APZ43719.1 biotin--[acetyl-CoA-carboxylase] ligase [Acidihalobacter ferrooxydans]
MFEPLDSNAIRLNLSSIGEPDCPGIHVHPSIDSTNNWFINELRAGRIESKHVCLAEEQRAGRGRRGRTWISPPVGNLYMSVGWAARNMKHSPEAITLAVGVAVCEVLEVLSGRPIDIKWPNDFYHDNRKLGGILIDGLSRNDKPFWVIGVGVNLRPVEHKTIDTVASAGLDEVWPDAHNHRNYLAARIIKAIFNACLSYEDNGFSVFRDRWASHDITIGRKLTVHQATGTLMQATGCGIDQSGKLRVICATSGDEYVLDAADVTLRVD